MSTVSRSESPRVLALDLDGPVLGPDGFASPAVKSALFRYRGPLRFARAHVHWRRGVGFARYQTIVGVLPSEIWGLQSGVPFERSWNPLRRTPHGPVWNRL